MAVKAMTVKELIEELERYDKDLEVGYEIGRTSIDLLIGEDPDDKKSGTITIDEPEWC